MSLNNIEEEMSQEQVSDDEDTAQNEDGPTKKKARKSSDGKKSLKPSSKKKSPSQKRTTDGRPHKKLEQFVLEKRAHDLQKKKQEAEARLTLICLKIEPYEKELCFRQNEAGN